MEELKNLDTIVAIATPIGPGGIGVIRISGAAAFQIIKKIFKTSSTVITPKFVHFGKFINPQTLEEIDTGYLIYFKSPASYTGEDVVEIQIHSSLVNLKRFVLLINQLGIRLAERGEFTRRAFLHGKLDLIQAETIIEQINANSPKAYQVALSHNKGKLYKDIKNIRKNFLKVLEQIEGSIDFPDEVEPISKILLTQQIRSTSSHIKDILDNSDYGKIIATGVQCLIIGRPNVGKSSLFNQLLGEKRAIVTSIPGTTRDFLTAQIEISGLLFDFYDTAGLRKSEDRIEKLGINKINKLLKKAHLVLWVIDGSKKLNTEDLEIYKKIKKFKNILLVINKTDLKQQINLFKDAPVLNKIKNIKISAKKNLGIKLLKETLQETIVAKVNSLDEELICNLRQIDCLNQSLKNLKQIQLGIQNKYEDDCLAIDLKNFILNLGELNGEDVTEEILDGIFSRFCVGK